MYSSRSRAAKVLRIAGLTAIAGVLIYAFSPAAQNQFGSVKPLHERSAAPEVRVQTLDGQTWSLSANKGKVGLINFWATWCPPCRVETPSLVSLHNRYSSEGFTVAGISMDDEPTDVVPAFARKYSISYPMLMPSAHFPMLDQVEALPTSILLDREGRVARIYRGIVTETGLRDDIEALLAEKVEGQ